MDYINEVFGISEMLDLVCEKLDPLSIINLHLYLKKDLTFKYLTRISDLISTLSLYILNIQNVKVKLNKCQELVKQNNCSYSFNKYSNYNSCNADYCSDDSCNEDYHSDDSCSDD